MSYPVDDWYGCYKRGWTRADLVPDAFSHPAKLARGLAFRIVEHLIAEGWLHEGDTVLDPFGGVATVALPLALKGVNYVGVELEERFVALGNANIALWDGRYAGKLPRWGHAVLLRGDSRRLLEVVMGAEGVVSSPPFTDSLNSTDRKFVVRSKLSGKWAQYRSLESVERQTATYGQTDGNLGNMAANGWEGAISSPPYESLHVVDKEAASRARSGLARTIPDGAADGGVRYGSGNGQLGTDTGADFWTAARQIVDQTYLALRPGAVAVWIVKSFVRDRQLVDFPGQWRQMCEAAGFVTLHEHRAWVVEDHGTQAGIEGDKRLRTERKSFFRRLAEKNGSPRIDFETVLCMRREAK